MQRLKSLERGISSASLEMAKIIGAVEKHELWAQMPNCGSFRQWLISGCPVSEQYARRLMAWALAYPDERLAIELGSERGYMLWRYAVAKRLNAQDLASRNAIIDGKPITSHTVDSLTRAAQLAESQAAEEPLVDDGPAVEPELDEPDADPEPEAPTNSAELEAEMTAAAVEARNIQRWLRREGVDGEALVRKRDGHAWVYVAFPADQARLLYDED